MTLDQLQSRLMAYFARHSPEQRTRSLGPLVVLTGGRASRLYAFTFEQAGSDDASDAAMVLKFYAPDAGGREHATREWRALTQLRLTGLSVPDVVIFEPDARHLGHPFIVMNRIPGTSFWDMFNAADPRAQDQLTRSFATQLAALHALDPRLLEPAAVLTDPYSYIEQELEQLRRDAARSPHAMLAEIVQWLERRKKAVPCERPVVLHRDYHPWNVLVDGAEHLWVIDWDWRIGDARFDLAWTCMLMRRSSFHTFSSAVRDEYVHQSGRTLDDLGYFEVLTTVRWVLNVLPAAESDALSDAARADFQAFLIEPVRQAQTFLQERTGVTVCIRMSDIPRDWPCRQRCR